MKGGSRTINSNASLDEFSSSHGDEYEDKIRPMFQRYLLNIALMMEAVSVSETSTSFYHTTHKLNVFPAREN
jgi:hypothetical protein